LHPNYTKLKGDLPPSANIPKSQGQSGDLKFFPHRHQCFAPRSSPIAET
jgi:hypothetical protein